jgi:hypothetical protein
MGRTSTRRERCAGCGRRVSRLYVTNRGWRCPGCASAVPNLESGKRQQPGGKCG